jgi:hypothetical protein
MTYKTKVLVYQARFVCILYIRLIPDIFYNGYLVSINFYYGKKFMRYIEYRISDIEFIAVPKNMFKFGYEFYVIRRNNAIPKQGNSYRNIIMITAIEKLKGR